MRKGYKISLLPFVFGNKITAVGFGFEFAHMQKDTHETKFQILFVVLRIYLNQFAAHLYAEFVQN